MWSNVPTSLLEKLNSEAEIEYLEDGEGVRIEKSTKLDEEDNDEDGVVDVKMHRHGAEQDGGSDATMVMKVDDDEDLLKLDRRGSERDGGIDTTTVDDDIGDDVVEEKLCRREMEVGEGVVEDGVAVISDIPQSERDGRIDAAMMMKRDAEGVENGVAVMPDIPQSERDGRIDAAMMMNRDAESVENVAAVMPSRSQGESEQDEGIETAIGIKMNDGGVEGEVALKPDRPQMQQDGGIDATMMLKSDDGGVEDLAVKLDVQENEQDGDINTSTMKMDDKDGEDGDAGMLDGLGSERDGSIDAADRSEEELPVEGRGGSTLKMEEIFGRDEDVEGEGVEILRPTTVHKFFAEV